MPILEALGLRAVEEVPTAVQGEGKVYIHDFGVLDARGAVLDLETAADAWCARRITAVWRGEAESDSLNRLVIFAGLTWQPGAASCARTASTASACRPRFTEEYRNDALAENPHHRGAARRAVRGEVRPGPRRDRTRTIEEIRQRRPRRPASRVLARPGSDPPSHARHDPARPCERTPTCRTARRCRSSSVPRTCPTCRSRSRCSRSSCTRRRWRRSTCGAGWSRAAGSAGPTARRTTARRSSGS